MFNTGGKRPLISPVTRSDVVRTGGVNEATSGGQGGGQQPMGQGPATTLGQDIYNTGSGLLNMPVAGNGFGQVKLNETAPANPWLRKMGQGIQNQTNEMLGQGLLGIQGNSVASGGLGGSRQGVAQGLALGNAANYMSNNLANMYGAAHEGQQNRNLQQYSLDQDFWGQQRQQDLAGTALGADLIGKGLNTQWLPLQNTGNIYSQFAGNGTTTNTANSGGGWQGALGGFLGTMNLLNGWGK